jgi:hypothetical protein
VTTTPALLALVATIALGAVIGLLFLQRLHRPGLVKAHLAAALVATGLVALLAMAAPPAAGNPPSFLPVALLAVAVAAGWGAKRLARRSRRGGELSLIAHVALGLAGFLVFLAWAKTV